MCGSYSRAKSSGSSRSAAGIGLAHRDGGRLAGHSLQDLFHPAFQGKPVVKDDVGGGQAPDVALRRPVEVRVDSGAHQAHHVDPVAADGPDGVGDHARGGHGVHPGLRPVRKRREKRSAKEEPAPPPPP